MLSMPTSLILDIPIVIHSSSPVRCGWEPRVFMNFDTVADCAFLWDVSARTENNTHCFANHPYTFGLYAHTTHDVLFWYLCTLVHIYDVSKWPPAHLSSSDVFVTGYLSYYRDFLDPQPNCDKRGASVCPQRGRLTQPPGTYNRPGSAVQCLHTLIKTSVVFYRRQQTIPLAARSTSYRERWTYISLSIYFFRRAPSWSGSARFQSSSEALHTALSATIDIHRAGFVKTSILGLLQTTPDGALDMLFALTWEYAEGSLARGGRGEVEGVRE